MVVMVVMVVESERSTRGARSQLTTRLDLRLSDEELDKNANNFAAITCVRASFCLLMLQR
jgi:hypothetical protein